MNDTVRRILIHGAMAAGFLAVIGVMYAELAGAWVAGQTPPRPGDGTPTADELAGLLRWRIPVTMAVWGFALVAPGELVASIWRKPRPAAPPELDPTALAEAEIQKILATADLTATPPPVRAG